MMIDKTIFKILLFPLTILYGIGISIRNLFYKLNINKSVSFNIPIISVGNLSVGGAGKSPHIEYLVALLKDFLPVAILSRGYSRKTKGFILAEDFHAATDIGDESRMFKQKFPDVTVAVGERRIYAIPEIIKAKPETKVILLDDAYQHRAVTPSLNILLTEYNEPFYKDILLPSGRLREFRSGYDRADIIIVSKCPEDVKNIDKEAIIKRINPLPHQTVFFSYYNYSKPYNAFNSSETIDFNTIDNVLLVSAIAKTDYILAYLDNKVDVIKSIEYADHHHFSHNDVSNILLTLKHIPSDKKIILTTEKDITRLELHRAHFIAQGVQVYVLPAKVGFHYNEGQVIDEAIKEHLLNFKV